MVLKDPVGPVAAFTPWNFPINQVVRKMSARAGHRLLDASSRRRKKPRPAPAALIQAFADAGVPAGVLGLVYGNPAEISSYLIPHPVIRKITFTGSTPVGKQLAALAGQHMKRVTMELGGHAPVIVAEDADVALAVKAAGGAKFRNAGQVCISPTRFLVHESIKQRLRRRAGQARAGPEGRRRPGRRHADGPAGQPAPPHGDGRVHAGRGRARRHRSPPAASASATPATSGQPTVLTDVPLEAKVFNDEPFGPMAAIRSFNTLDEAIAEANRLPYGLAGYAFTRSLKNAHLLAQRVEVGMLWINHAGDAVGRDAVRRRQGFGLRLRRRAGGAGGLPEHALGLDHERLSGIRLACLCLWERAG